MFGYQIEIKHEDGKTQWVKLMAMSGKGARWAVEAAYPKAIVLAVLPWSG